MARGLALAGLTVIALLLAATPTPSPSLDPEVLEPDPITTIAAIVAIAFALAAAVIGYRIIRGGRGL